MYADIAVKIYFNDEEKAKAQDAIEMMNNIAKMITKCTCTEGVYDIANRLIGAAITLQDILNNDGVVED